MWEVWWAPPPPRVWTQDRAVERRLLTAPCEYLYGRIHLPPHLLAGMRDRPAFALLQAHLEQEVRAMARDLGRWCADWERDHEGEMLIPFDWGWLEVDGQVWRPHPQHPGLEGLEGWVAVWYTYFKRGPLHLPTYCAVPDLEYVLAQHFLSLVAPLHTLRQRVAGRGA